MTPSPSHLRRSSSNRPQHLVLTIVALACGWAQALTLADVQPLSHVGEPFKAQIKITDFNAEQLASLSVKLSPPAAYDNAHLKVDPALDGLQASIQHADDGSTVIQLSSTHAVQSAQLDFILDLKWSDGTMTRQFAVSVPATSEDSMNSEAPVVVVKGDTLSELMITHRYGVGTLAQRMIATLRANPKAFIKDNINWVRAGEQLHLPSRDEILSIDAQEAQSLVNAQIAAFDAYRQALAQKARLAKEQSQANQGSVEQGVKGGAQAPTGDRLALAQSTPSGAQADENLATQKNKAAGAAREAELKANLQVLDKIAQKLDAATSSGSATTQATAQASDGKGLTLPTPAALAGATSDATKADGAKSPPSATDTDNDAPKGEPKWITRMKSSPLLLPGVALLLVLLAVWVLLRRKQPSIATDAWAFDESTDVKPQAEIPSADIDEIAPTLEPVEPNPLTNMLAGVDLDLPDLDTDAPAPVDGETLLTQAKQALRDENFDQAKTLATQAMASDDASVQANAKALLERL